ncbi:glycoside hydrolase family 31 protein [Autumnicola musiva]|uniref:Glycoside hydrolase family 31 protein n=1 Tax=Autumnicola musiva TaxID=3075589 RepID=A0ABU3DAJ1_9FLAO|nr:glycoside hydrolase family 31 protein [Zunongwangia sp. F117]MDT0678557.1 glycoside hydrolase family 31 protein [Zunongwangia sp. F117]
MASFFLKAQEITDSTTVELLPEEKWWAGVVREGHLMPFEPNEEYSIDLMGNNEGNQIQPLLLSDKGRIIWSESPIKFTIGESEISVASYGSPIDVKRSSKDSNLKEAFQFASSEYFPASGKIPDTLLFTKPQYNTWIELIYNQNQEDILEYAQNIIKNGFPPGVLMIDDNWQEDYGKWQFHEGRFEDPKEMVDSLHQMGFKVMLWVCPFVSPDSDVYRNLEDKKYLIQEATGDNNPLIVRWWNGASGVLDFTNPGAVSWYEEQLDRLVDTYGIDGFKFDAGDSYFYDQPLKSFKDVSPNEHTLTFQKFGLKYPLNEYRASWKMGGQPLAQRLHDKGHNWDDLQMLIPQMLLQGLIGYPFNAPDMIGGGEFGSFINLEAVDQELIVRSAQVHALMPMMQFSVAPWRVLDEKHFEAVQKSVELRKQYLPLIMDLVHQASENGEPIVRPMEYEFPGEGYYNIKDQFMLGSDILVAPILQRGVSSRTVILPKGRWTWKDKIYKGGKNIEIEVALNELPVFERK